MYLVSMNMKKIQKVQAFLEAVWICRTSVFWDRCRIKVMCMLSFVESILQFSNLNFLAQCNFSLFIATFSCFSKCQAYCSKSIYGTKSSAQYLWGSRRNKTCSSFTANTLIPEVQNDWSWNEWTYWYWSIRSQDLLSLSEKMDILIGNDFFLAIIFVSLGESQ
jgi:hypothetical protein